MCNRLRYTLWAPAYDAIARLAGFDGARRLSIDRLRLAPGDSVSSAPVRRGRDAPDPRSHAGTGTRLEGGGSGADTRRPHRGGGPRTQARAILRPFPISANHTLNGGLHAVGHR
jgi:hypothetical protein